MTAAAAHKPRNARVFARVKDDWYCEPAWCTASLLSVEDIPGPARDPACGRGHVVEALLAAGVPAIGTDLVRRCPPETVWWGGHRDFLRPAKISAASIVSNPPFGRGHLAEQFIARALDVATHKVAVFVPLRFLTGIGRWSGLYRERPPHRAWVLAPRPSCPPGAYLEAGGRAEGGTADFCWLVWDLQAEPARAGEMRMGAAFRPGGQV